MSVQFGKWNFDRKPMDPTQSERLQKILRPFGPDKSTSHCGENATILYCALQTTKESRDEVQPCVTKSGKVITWDGRLDNRKELIQRLGSVSGQATDVSIAAAAYEAWNTECFAELVGDWAISIWNREDQSLILAKDVIGIRHLYYCIEQDYLMWSTLLHPLLVVAEHPFELDTEYIAGFLSFFPAPHLTPYKGIQSVPPACFVHLRNGVRRISKYWDFDPGKVVRYRTDSDYEEHFREVFAHSVQRRLRSDSPILAELSGGIDSSSIVCMADMLLQRWDAEAPRLDTLSYFSDSEPNWNERPYFTKIEEQRGRTGLHIDVCSNESHLAMLQTAELIATPGHIRRPTQTARTLKNNILGQGNRVLLSGIGGDEVTGGIPIPIPELADLIAAMRLPTLARQLKAWALSKRKPILSLLGATFAEFLPQTLLAELKRVASAAWLQDEFMQTNRHALAGYPRRFKLFSAPPSFQDRTHTIDAMRRLVASSTLSCEPAIEKRYPYLDRCLLEFLCAVPMQQLIRPGQRRSLVRRSLRELVPVEILERKRKAYVTRQPIVSIDAEWRRLMESTPTMVSSSLGIINQKAFAAAVEKAQQGQSTPVVLLARTLAIEFWLRNVTHHGVMSESMVDQGRKDAGRVARRDRLAVAEFS